MKRKANRLVAVFTQEHCNDCPRKAECPVKDGKRGRYLRYDSKSARLARRRALEKTGAFREKYRFRSGIEATMSEFDRRTGVKHLRVRGLKAVRFSVFLKATGLNILRAATFRAKIEKTTKKQTNSRNGGHFRLGFAVIKEHLAAVFRLLGMFPEYCLQNKVADDSYSLWTAV